MRSITSLDTVWFVLICPATTAINSNQWILIDLFWLTQGTKIFVKKQKSILQAKLAKLAVQIGYFGK